VASPREEAREPSEAQMRIRDLLMEKRQAVASQRAKQQAEQ
jgi:hypothetical protein